MSEDKLEEMLIRHEGLRLKPYHCTAGKLTIGIGRNLEDVGITEAEARMMLRYDIESRRSQLLKFPWFREMNEPRQDAILDMSFMGVGRLLEFVKMIKALERGDFKTAAQEMLNSRWALQVGDGPGNNFDRAEELSRMIENGEYQGK